VQADRALIADFVAQAHEHLDAAEPLLLELEKSGRVPAGALDEIFRAVHSIKGAAGFLALAEVQDLAHALESLLMRLRDGEIGWRAALADPLLRGVAHMRALLAGLPDAAGDLDRELIGQLEALAAEGDASGRAGDRLLADCAQQRRRGHSLALVPLPARLQARAEFIARLRRYGALVREDFPEPRRALVGTPLELDLLAEALELAPGDVVPFDPASAPAAAPRVDAPLAARATESIRVRVGLLDRLMDLAGELVLARNQLRPFAEGPAKPLVANLDRITTELQESIMHTRLQPLRVLFDRLPRLVRDIGRRVGKPAEVAIEGGDVELDRSLVEALADPLTHLLRNALDHGLEAAAERAERGKPERGRLSLRAQAGRGRVLIELEDDGRGIDLDDVRAAAVRRGVLAAEQAEALSEREALELIFQPGVSTASGVTDLSGRGVGLDVVRTNIERLGGHIEVETRPGAGTRFRIDLPLTLAIVPALVVSAGGEAFAVPQASVIEVVRFKPGERGPERVRGREMLRLRGRLLALVRLDEVLSNTRPPSEHRARRPDAGRRQRALVVRCAAARFALVVDELHDGEEIVVKPLPSFVRECACYSGCTILGDGRIALILEPAGIARSAGLRPDELPDEPGIGPTDPSIGSTDPMLRRRPARSLVLFDGAAGERFAVALDSLLRLESLRPEQIERVGAREFFEHRGRVLPLIRLHDVLPLGAGVASGEELFVLIPRARGSEVGIAAARIVDTVLSDAQPEPGVLRAPGVVGSALVKDRLTLFLDPAALVEGMRAAQGA
jgi:two-component system chemotaxis sensor kinase CheA